MLPTGSKSAAKPGLPKAAEGKPPDIATAPVPDTLASLHANPASGFTQAEVDVRRKQIGYNEVAFRKGHPVSHLWEDTLPLIRASGCGNHPT